MSTLYEENVKRLLEEKRRRLEELLASVKEESRDEDEGYAMDSNSKMDDAVDRVREEIYRLEHEIHVLEMLYENYSSSMGAFRRTKGARKIR